MKPFQRFVNSLENIKELSAIKDKNLLMNFAVTGKHVRRLSGNSMRNQLNNNGEKRLASCFKSNQKQVLGATVSYTVDRKGYHLFIEKVPFNTISKEEI